MVSENNSSSPVDTAKQSPNVDIVTFSNGQYWKDNLTNNDFLYLYRRNGIGKKIIRMFKNDMFKHKTIIDDNKYDDLREQYNMDEVVKLAHTNASVSGWSLIYLDYGDVVNTADYDTDAPVNKVPTSLYVIPRAWIKEDSKQEGQDHDRNYYEISQASGSTFKIHESRILRVNVNDEESSLFESSYNSLWTADNALWSTGQALWRFGQGFPVITIKDPEDVVDEATGQTMSEAQYLKSKGLLRNINSQTGFIGDERYNFDFKGAEGKALKPAEFWEIILEWISMSVDIPKDVLRGASAGAVTGSQTNLEIYYSTVHSKQTNEVTPIYKDIFNLLNIALKDTDFIYLPVFEQSQEQQSITFKTDNEGLAISIQNGILTKEQSFDILQRRHPYLKLESYEVEPSEPIPTNNTNQPNIDSNDKDDHDVLDPNLDIKHIMNQHKDDSPCNCGCNDAASLEDSPLPNSVQKTESKYMKDMFKQYKETNKSVFNILDALNTD